MTCILLLDLGGRDELLLCRIDRGTRSRICLRERGRERKRQREGERTERDRKREKEMESVFERERRGGRECV